MFKFLNNKRKCCNCKKYFNSYLPIDKYYIEQPKKHGAKKSNPETLNYKEYMCPFCYCLDRDRLCLAFLEKLNIYGNRRLEKVNNKRQFKLIDFAPSAPVTKSIKKNYDNILYKSADLYMKEIDIKIDIQHMDIIENKSIDIWICFHILEHVDNDILAMKELYRILKNDGLGLLLVPIDLKQTTTDEELGLTEEENWKRFGQGDHVRKYSKQDFINRLRNVGFHVYELGKDFYGKQLFKENAWTKTSCLYVVDKGDGTKDVLDFFWNDKVENL